MLLNWLQYTILFTIFLISYTKSYHTAVTKSIFCYFKSISDYFSADFPNIRTIAFLYFTRIIEKNHSTTSSDAVKILNHPPLALTDKMSTPPIGPPKAFPSHVRKRFLGNV